MLCESECSAWVLLTVSRCTVNEEIPPHTKNNKWNENFTLKFLECAAHFRINWGLKFEAYMEALASQTFKLKVLEDNVF